MAPSAALKYKIKLSSGRVLGPLDLERIRLLVKKGKITGTEIAKEYPNGDWVDVNRIPLIAELIVLNAKGALEKQEQTFQQRMAGAGTTRMLPNNDPTVPLARQRTLQLQDVSRSRSKTQVQMPSPPDVPEERTVVQKGEPSLRSLEAIQEAYSEPEPSVSPGRPAHDADPEPQFHEADPYYYGDDAAYATGEPTVLMSTPAAMQAQARWTVGDAVRDPRKAPAVFQKGVRDLKAQVIALLTTLSVIYIIYTFLFSVDPKPIQEQAFVPIRPSLPTFEVGAKDPVKSTKLYSEAIKYYVRDTVPGYKAAAQLLGQAVRYDNTNAKALAMLASCYLNLIDSSNKDENYFSVISRLIEFSRVKDVDLPETVIADVEFYITVNKAEAAENRVVDYTKTQTVFAAHDAEMFYYLALAFYHRGDPQSAARYINQYAEDKAFSPKVFYLRGQIAEQLGDPSAAIHEYEKAIKMNPAHAKSRLALANIMNQNKDLQGAAAHLDFIIRNPGLLAPSDMAKAYYLHGKLSQSYQKMDVARGDLERAVSLERENHEYLLELDMLLAKTGENVQNMRPSARMYFFLGQGEKHLKEGDYHEALTEFLQAREANDKSPLPPVKIGDMFLHMNDLGNARLNYKMAADRAPNSIEVWSKYISALIQSYDWTEAMQAMDRFRKLPVPQSAIDKAAADMYAKQGRQVEAQSFYRKAMARDTIDSGVYIAYAKSLIETKNYKDAPFFFALALRFDPFNIDALIGTAKCIAATESIDRAITMLQDQLQKGSTSRSTLLTAIADFYAEKGAWKQAQDFVDQARDADPDAAEPWKIQARIYLNDEATDKNALKKALDAYASYSDRNSSDPSGYLERYQIFVRRGEFDHASEELGKIFGIYPKYPNLHYYKGLLYSMMSNNKLAIEEYQAELKNNPGSVSTLIALGKEYEKSGVVAQALTLFNQAMQFAPRSAEAKLESGYANYLLKNFSGAIALYNAALQIDQGNPLIYKRLGMAYRETGDRNGAEQAFRKYKELEPEGSTDL